MIVAVSQGVAERYGERMRAFDSSIELVWPEGEGWTGDVQAAEAVFFSEDFWTSGQSRTILPLLFTLPNLRWFHSFSAGVDHPVFKALVERGVTLTNSSGSTSEPIAQYVIGMMLRVAKRMDEWSSAQRDGRWESIESGELTSKTVGIVGVGNIGGEVARLAKAFRMRVIGCRRRQRPMRNVDSLVPPERLHELLAQSDFVVLAVPLTSQTDGLIGEAELRAMRDGAWLINIARGQVVDETALVRALKGGWIGGACLDVFQEEPLPEASELWSLQNVIVTPHNSGRSPLNADRGAEIFLANLERYVARKPLRNRVRLSDF